VWVLRELSRLLIRIAVAVAIASAVAGIKAAVSGGGFAHTWRITIFALAALMLLLATAGAKGTASNRRLNQGVDHASNFVFRIPGVPLPTGGPTLTAGAVFIGSAAVLLVLGFIV
jgi:predicted membrane channel-forming protein YqfA (hemolysin III family)